MYRFHQGGHWTETAVAFPALSSKCGALRVEDMWRPWDLQKSIAISTRRISRQRPEYVWGRPHGFRLPLSARGSVFHLKPASCTRRNSVSQSGDTLSNHKAIISQEKLSWTSLNFVCDFDCGQQRRHCEDGSAGHEKTNHTQLMGLQMCGGSILENLIFELVSSVLGQTQYMLTRWLRASSRNMLFWGFV